MSPETPSLGRQVFPFALLLSTWIPMVFFIGVGSFGTPGTLGTLGTLGSGLHTIRAALLFVGGLHVASTLILYLDKEFLRLVRAEPGRYIYLPIAFILASGTIFTFASPASQLGAYVLFWGWQTYHYGRQNVGVYSFASIARGWRPHPLERRALQLTVACAICGTFKITSQFLDRDAAPGVLHAIFDTLYRLGALGFVGVVVFSLYAFFKRGNEISVGKAVCFFTLVLFFGPMFLSHNVDVAFFSYAIAHGTQYLVFMAALSFGLGARDGRRGVSSAMIAVAAFMLVIGIVGASATQLKSLAVVTTTPAAPALLDFLAGISLGLTVSHFVIDAGAWRLSRPSVRQYVTRRFAFLFEPAAR